MARTKCLFTHTHFFFSLQQHHYSTLHRVIDVLGLQVIEDNSNSSYGRDLEKNPAYRNLKAQQEIVNGAIEHMAVM